jgi:uncharacterized protein YcfJ
MKIISTLTAFVLSASIANADGYSNDYAVITDVQPVYVNRFVDKYERRCVDVEVPVYGRTRSGSSGDVLAGAIIGGVIGNQFGNGSGKDAMTILGVIAGANQGANSKRDAVIGYRVENQCHTIQYTVNEPIISYYNIHYSLDGVTYRQETTRRYELGQRVKVKVSLN